MKTKRLAATTTLMLLVSAPLFGGCDRGGCPWTVAGDVRVSPSSPCLDLVIDDSVEAAGGCVNPVLLGRNDCGEALSFPAEVAEDAQAHVFEPGAAIELELELENRSIASETEDGFDWAVPATLGDAAVTVRFSTWID